MAYVGFYQEDRGTAFMRTIIPVNSFLVFYVPGKLTEEE